MKKEILEKLKNSDNYEKILKIAEEYILSEKGKRKVAFISHSIYSQGEEFIEKNKNEILDLIEEKTNEEIFIFNQIYFLGENLPKLKIPENDPNFELENFFKPLFKNFIEKVYFHKKSLEISRGTKMEKEYVEKFGIDFEIFE